MRTWIVTVASKFKCTVHQLVHVGRDGSFFSRRHELLLFQHRSQLGNRIAFAQVTHLVFGPIGFRIALEVPKVPVGFDFNQRGTLTPSGAGNGRCDSFKNMHRIVFRDAYARNAVPSSAVCNPLHRSGFGLGHGDGPMVVFTNEDDRQLPHRSQVQGLVEGTLVGRTFTKEGHRHPVFAHLFGGQRRTTGNRHAGTNDAAATELVRVVKQVHMTALAFTQPRDLAKHFSRHGVERHAFGDGEVMRPVCTHHCVVIRQMRTNAHRHRLLACSQMHLTRHGSSLNVKSQTFLNCWRQLALHVHRCHGLFVIANLNHLLVHPEKFFFADLHGEPFGSM